jgi:L-amino acid N-acyltransferase YncA
VVGPSRQSVATSAFLDHFWSYSRIVEDEHGLAAFLLAFISPSEARQAYVHFVGVRPDHRRSGLARELYEDFAGYASELGCAELRAVTAPSNTASIRFHRNVGFTVSKPVADYNGPGRPMVTFRRQLDVVTNAR